MPETLDQELDKRRGQGGKKRLRASIAVLLLLSLVVIVLGLWWSSEPATFSVDEAVEKYAGLVPAADVYRQTGGASNAGTATDTSGDQAESNPDSLNPEVTEENPAVKKADTTAAARMHVQSTLPKGVATVSTMLALGNRLLEKPGGYLSNDKLPPGIYLDNMPNWEFGVLVQLRDAAKALREAHSRSQTQSKENPHLVIAEPKLNIDSENWVFPSAEGEYHEGLESLALYLGELTDASKRDSQFYSRADNLRYWLRTVESRLGSLSQLLSASVGKKRLNTDLAGDPRAQQSTRSEAESVVKTPWLEIDDNFYYARGASYALLHLLKASAVDFAEVLENKNAAVSLQQIIRELEATQDTVYSPMILNGSGFGLVTNHSLIMASYISRANAGVIELRELLAKG